MNPIKITRKRDNISGKEYIDFENYEYLKESISYFMRRKHSLSSMASYSTVVEIYLSEMGWYCCEKDSKCDIYEICLKYHSCDDIYIQFFIELHKNKTKTDAEIHYIIKSMILEQKIDKNI